MASASKPSNLPMMFILITVVLDSVGFGIIMPVLPSLIEDVMAVSLSEAATWGGYLLFAYAAMQFGFGPIMGNLSDRFGRRPVLLISLGVMAVDYIIMGLAHSFILLLIGRFIAGIAAATHSTASAYIADISAPEKRAVNFGMIGAAFGVGFVFGPVIGGLLGELGPRAPFFAAASVAALNFVFGLVVMRESLKPENRRPFQWRRANPFGAFRKMAEMPQLVRLLIVLFVFNLAFAVYPSVWAYYTEAQFDFSTWETGVTLGAFGISSAIVQGGLIRFIIPRLGEHWTVIYGMSLQVATFVGYVFIPYGWMIYLLLPLAALGGVAGPALAGIMSRSVGDDQQGELQGVNASIAAVSMTIAPLVLTQAFTYFTGPNAPFNLPGAPFALSAILLAFALVVFLGRRRLGGVALENK